MTDELDLIALRRELHAWPELGYQEHKTAARVAELLAAAGYEVHTGIAETGVVAVLEGQAEGPTIAWRADMDALPIDEVNDVAYRSCRPGLMHACGHDVHTTVGLGVAHALAGDTSFAGRRVFVFQPNEEGAPGAGLSGGDAVVAEGVLERFAIDHVLALHCMPSLDVGCVGWTPTAAWAASDRLLLTVRGRQTHGAYPHLGVDPIVAASQLVLALQTVPSRAIDAQQACVLSVCQFHAGQSFNILPGEVRMEGIVRTLDDAVRRQVRADIERVARGIAEATGTTIEVEVHSGAELTANDPALVERSLPLLRAAVGDERVVRMPAQMGAEDFAAFAQRRPCAYFFLGVRGDDPARTGNSLHSPDFDVDERCLEVGVRAGVALLRGLGDAG